MLILTIIVFILILALLVMIHEFGHFIVARRNGIQVQEFGFGFPPRLWQKKKKGTLYSINAIPLGGFVKMLGEEEHIDHQESFSTKSPWVRIKVVVAGVILNFLLAWILLSIWLWAVPANLPNQVAVVQVNSNSAAKEADIKPNDFIIKVGGEDLVSSGQLTEFTTSHQGQEVIITIKRYNKEIEKSVKLSDDETAPLGISMADTGGEVEKPIWYLAPWEALKEMAAIIWISAVYLYKFIISLFGAAKVSTDVVSGPVGIFTFLYQIMSFGWIYVLRFIALLSLSLAFFNLLPFPALDGGRLVFLAAEAIGGKKIIKSEIENALHWIGFMILLVLVGLVTYQDVVKWILHK